jgi:hypothetical protein
VGAVEAAFKALASRWAEPHPEKRTTDSQPIPPATCPNDRSRRVAAPVGEVLRANAEADYGNSALGKPPVAHRLSRDISPVSRRHIPPARIRPSRTRSPRRRSAQSAPAGAQAPVSLGDLLVPRAAAQALAEGRLRPVFGLFYDARNPYFTGAGNWPGWVAVLQETLSARSDVAFYAVSWQALLASVPLDDETRAWAVEKHGLEGVDT